MILSSYFDFSSRNGRDLIKITRKGKQAVFDMNCYCQSVWKRVEIVDVDGARSEVGTRWWNFFRQTSHPIDRLSFIFYTFLLAILGNMLFFLSIFLFISLSADLGCTLLKRAKQVFDFGEWSESEEIEDWEMGEGWAASFLASLQLLLESISRCGSTISTSSIYQPSLLPLTWPLSKDFRPKTHHQYSIPAGIGSLPKMNLLVSCFPKTFQNCNKLKVSTWSGFFLRLPNVCFDMYNNIISHRCSCHSIVSVLVRWHGPDLPGFNVETEVLDQ